MREATRYYEKLYSNCQSDESIAVANRVKDLGVKRNIDTVEKPFERIMKFEIRHVKNLKLGKASGPDTIEDESMEMF